MRHRKKFNHLSRTSSHRKAMLANMACSLIEHKRINTTLAKAKALRMYVEPLITKSKADSTHSRRTVFSYLKNKYAVTELFREVAPKIADRPGGYTRIIKTGHRLGDGAEMAMIELVDFNDVYQTEKKAAKKPSRRRRRGGGSGSKAEGASAATEAAVAEEPAVEDAEVVEETPKAEATEETKAEASGDDQTDASSDAAAEEGDETKSE